MSDRRRRWAREAYALAWTFPELPVIIAIAVVLLAYRACSS